MNIDFTEPELYLLFLIVDSRCRADKSPSEDIIAMREKLLPVYRARHAAPVARD